MTAAAPPALAAVLCAAIDRYHDVLTAYVGRGGEDHLALADRRVRRVGGQATTLCNVHAGAGTVPTFIIGCDPR